MFDTCSYWELIQDWVQNNTFASLEISSTFSSIFSIGPTGNDKRKYNFTLINIDKNFILTHSVPSFNVLSFVFMENLSASGRSVGQDKGLVYVYLGILEYVIIIELLL